MEEITSIIQTLGLPAGMCACMAWFIWKQVQFTNNLYGDLKITIQQNTEVIYELKETVGSLKQQVDSLDK